MYIFVTLITINVHLCYSYHNLCTSLLLLSQSMYIFVTLITIYVHLCYSYHNQCTSLLLLSQSMYIFVTLITIYVYLCYSYHNQCTSVPCLYLCIVILFKENLLVLSLYLMYYAFTVDECTRYIFIFNTKLCNLIIKPF